jgi:HAD superfamily hydrolase (TIGR01509 family)
VTTNTPNSFLFDFDGTLVDSAPLHDWAFREVLLAECPHALGQFSYERVRGRATKEVFREAGVDHPAELSRLTALKQHYYQQAVREGRLNVFPGATDLLAALSSAGRNLYLVTSGSRASVEVALQATGLGRYFEGVVTSSEVARGKPSPELYLETIRRFGLEAADCIAIEDAPSGAEAARAAGLEVVMVNPAEEFHRSLLSLALELSPSPKTWAVIPAAGRGSRLGLDRPKILAPVDEARGETIWSILEAKLKPFVERIQLVLSPSGAEWFTRSAAADIAIQDRPLGMGDAVFRGASSWKADRILVIWGDQVNLSSETFERTLRAHACASQHPSFVLPRVWKQSPYVQYDFDQAGRVTGVRQTREGDSTDAEGWSDVGLFCLSTQGLEPLWRDYLSSAVRGSTTGEINFLPFLPYLSARGWKAVTWDVVDPDEARGVNTPADLEFARERWRRVTGSS